MSSAPGFLLQQFRVGTIRGYLGHRFRCRDGACPVLPTSSYSRCETRQAASLREINEGVYDTSGVRVFSLTSSLRMIASAISRIVLRFCRLCF
jgi:hypothetical protein